MGSSGGCLQGPSHSHTSSYIRSFVMPQPRYGFGCNSAAIKHVPVGQAYACIHFLPVPRYNQRGRQLTTATKLQLHACTFALSLDPSTIQAFLQMQDMLSVSLAKGSCGQVSPAVYSNSTPSTICQSQGTASIATVCTHSLRARTVQVCPVFAWTAPDVPNGLRSFLAHPGCEPLGLLVHFVKEIHLESSCVAVAIFQVEPHHTPAAVQLEMILVSARVKTCSAPSIVHECSKMCT